MCVFVFSPTDQRDKLRLWCIFEMAAFLKSHEHSDLVVQPLCIAQFVFGLFAMTSLFWYGAIFLPYGSVLTVYIYTLGLLVFACFLSTVVHRYHQDVETMQCQLQSFSVAKSQCHCCSVEHKGPDGKTMSCDKEIMIRCIDEWFGSTEEFESCVQTKVRDALSQQLGRVCFPYTAVTIASLPLLWCEADFASARWLGHDLLGGLSSLFTGLYGLFVLCMPPVAAVFLTIRYTPRCCSLLRKLLATAAHCFTALCIHGSLQLCVDRAGVFFGEIIWAGLLLVPSLLLWWFATRAQRVLSK